jgi:hypothetical protein
MSIIDQKASGFFAHVIRKTVKHREESGEKRDDLCNSCSKLAPSPMLTLRQGMTRVSNLLKEMPR